MNCPRCTHDLPSDSRFCPSCGLDLEKVNEDSGIMDAPPVDAILAGDEQGPAFQRKERSPWPQWLSLQSTKSFKKPGLASVMAFFLGPFAYLYLEQMPWFWCGLAGLFVSVILFFRAVFGFGELESFLIFAGVLHIGGILHAWDVARILNEHNDGEDYEDRTAGTFEEEGI